MKALSKQQNNLVGDWLPPLVGGFFAWVIFLTLGETPLIRASGLAVVIVGMTLALRQMGAIPALAGGLTLAFCPAFWSQTGGSGSLEPGMIILAIGLTAVFIIAFIAISKNPYLALGLGFLIFAVIFWSQISTPRSLRLTGLLTVWLLVILINSLHTSNPRPGGPPSKQITSEQYMGLLIILFIGVINDPLFVLLLPTVIIGLWFCHTPLRWWYWTAACTILVVGIWGFASYYVDADLWNSSALEAHNQGLQIKLIIVDGWHEGIRWVDLVGLITSQVTIIGVALGILGLARMARWYPVMGIVLMLAYMLYAIFGLTYFGNDRSILLMPLFIIQIIWLTYAVHTFGDWLTKGTNSGINTWRLVTSLYLLLPLYLLLNIEL